MIGPFKNQYEFLSNFSSSVIFYDGFTYPTVEHAFQASKSMNYAIRKSISEAKTPGNAKSIGRHLELRPYWHNIKIAIMTDLVAKKFAIRELQIKLLDTGNEELVEKNWWNDVFWGVCNGIGENNLGKILMNIRENIRKGNL
ncbi:MAG: NADAR family protein [Methanothrix sp.]|jgi:ribA/ribD-fused uncharacterized protein|nr:NADAR family protein [Methanothrix sp.]